MRTFPRIAAVRIHIVEDDFGVRDSLIELATGLGHPVLAYSDGESFIQAPPPSPEDLVFVDLGLPGIGGVEVVDWLHSLPGLPKVIVISGRPLVDIDSMLTRLPNLPLLRKPLTPEAIAPYL
jgi:FixJ family two-component response regulator